MEMSDRLVAFGYAVCGHASRGKQALQRVPTARPDVILMDINLGRGPNGIDFAELLRPTCAAPGPSVGVHRRRADERVARAGAVGCLVKPFHPNKLDAAIRATLAR